MRDLPVGKIPHTDTRKRIQNAGTLRRVNPSEKPISYHKPIAASSKTVIGWPRSMSDCCGR